MNVQDLQSNFVHLASRLQTVTLHILLRVLDKKAIIWSVTDHTYTSTSKLTCTTKA